MDKLLNFNEPIDVNLLDQIVNAVYQGNDQQRNEAQAILTRYKEHPQAWTRVDTILEQSPSDYTQYFALQILDDLIKYRWKILPLDQRTGIKNFLVALIIRLTGNEQQLARHKLVTSRLDVALVQILKQDWPHHWKTFIPEIVTASRNNECICENNMKIFMTLSEEVFDFSRDEMTQGKIAELKNSLNQEFFMIYQLCEFVLDNSKKPTLLIATLETLLKYLSWIPLGYIFETKLLETLIMKFLPMPQFRNVTLKCLSEIASLRITEYPEQFEMLFVATMGQLATIAPPGTDFRVAYDRGGQAEQDFIQNLALFLAAFFDCHRQVVEKDQHAQAVLGAHHYLVQISTVNNLEVFQICLDYWNQLAQNLYNEAPVVRTHASLVADDMPVPTPRRKLYAPVLSRVRTLVISRMAKPEEIIIVEDEAGHLIRERVPDGEATARYELMRNTLVYLTHLDYEDTINIMLGKLTAQVDGSEWSWYNLNTLCWAIGSISEVLSEGREKKFLVTVIKDLLWLTEMKKGKENKAVIASDIMYIVGQYPRFLKAHWKFLSTVVNKLFEFMHESHPGVQDMSCDTLLKIARKCQEQFAIIHDGDSEPFTAYVLTHIGQIISDLTDQQIHTFYEAVGYMIAAHVPQERDTYISRLMELPNQTWLETMNLAKQKVEYLTQLPTIRRLANILKTNVHACLTIGPSFISQLAKIYLDVLNVYKFYSEQISQAVAQGGVNATKTAAVKEMRIVKRETLKLITTYIGLAVDVGVVQNLLPPLLPSVLQDYRASLPDARDAEVLALMEKIIAKCGNAITGEIPRILDSVFECTLQMITKNFEEYPEIRVEFYKFLRAINRYCFDAFKRMRPEHFKLVINSIVWGFKHTMRNISEESLNILLELLEQIHRDSPAVANSFYQTYFLGLLQDIFFVLTDTFHKSGFKLHARILLQMISAVEHGASSSPLWDPAKITDPNMNNRQFLRQHICSLLVRAFGNLSEQQVLAFVAGLFDLDQDLTRFQKHLRDFLIKIKEFSGGDDNSQLYTEEQEAEKSQKSKQEMSVPGLVRVHDPRHNPASMSD